MVCCYRDCLWEHIENLGGMLRMDQNLVGTDQKLHGTEGIGTLYFLAR